MSPTPDSGAPGDPPPPRGSAEVGPPLDSSDQLTLARATAGPAERTVPTGTVEYAPGGDESDLPTVQLPGSKGPAPKQADAPGESAVPVTIAGYEVLEVLGRGAMGVVYKARHLRLDRLVAIKMILAGAHAGSGQLARFETEARAVAGLQHPNIVAIHEVGEHDGLPFLSLEYCPGGSLARHIAGTPQPPREAARLVQLLAGAVSCAHQAGIIHRDLKPGNVLLVGQAASLSSSEGQAGSLSYEPKITDFGLAKRLEDDGGQTQSGSILGTPGYMAPEQAEGRAHEVGPPADIYALGAILYELLTGRVPFRAPTVLETLEQVRSREPVAPTELQPGLPRDLETICLKCLHKLPGKRYSSAALLADDLDRFLRNEPIRARPVGRAERAWRWCRRNPWLAGLGAAMALVLLGWAVSMSVLAWRLKVQTDETERHAAVALANEETARRNEEIARRNEEQAKQSEARARAGKEAVARQYGHALQELSQLGLDIQKRLNDRRLAQQAPAEAHRLRVDLLELFRRRLLSLARTIERSGTTSFGMLAAHQHLGDLLQRLGQGEEAVKQFRLGHDLAEKIAREQPNSDKARANLVVMLMRLGDTELELNADARAARAHYENGRRLRQAIAAAPRSGDYSELDHQIALSHLEVRLGKAALELGEPLAAREHFRKAQRYRQLWCDKQPKQVNARSYLAETYLWLGVAGWHVEDGKGALEALDRAERICTALCRRFGQSHSFQADLADVLGHRGDAHVRLGQAAEAEKNYRASLEQVRAAVGRAPEEAGYQLLLALAHERLAGSAARKGNRVEARQGYREALRIRQELLEMTPSSLPWQAARWRALALSGQPAEAARQAEALCRRHPGRVPLLLQEARCHAIRAAAARDSAARRAGVDQALAALRGAAKAGYRDVMAVKTDPDLAALREEAAYQSLLKELAKR
jgi:serine/threonine-protein kinase